MPSPAPTGSRLWRALPKWDALDKQIASIALPSVANLMIFPLVTAVDTYWVGRMGDALALAAQGAANQVFSSIFWVIAFLPSVTTPLVAKAAASGDQAEARSRVCEAAFLAGMMGLIGSVILGCFTPWAIALVLAPNAPARSFALPYLQLRALSFVPALLSTVGFASFRGVMDTVTPLKVSVVSNLINVLMDPILMFHVCGGMGVAGAAAATVLSEVISGVIYVALLFRRGLMTKDCLFQVPSFSRLLPLLQGGAAIQMRSLALNAAFITATRRAQQLDSSGISAAAYAISLQFWQLGGVAFFALQGSGSILVAREKAKGGPAAARVVADRMLALGACFGVVVGCFQLLALPALSAFSTLPEVRRAAVTPVAIASFMSAIAGVVFAGEGIMMGRGAWGSLAAITGFSASTMVLGLEIARRCQLGLPGVWLSISAFNLVNLIGVLRHHLLVAPRQDAKASEQQAVRS